MINTVAIVGAGALGVMYGSVLAERYGNERVVFIAAEDRLARYKENTFMCNGAPCGFRFVSADAYNAKADLVIFAVKATGLAKAMEDAAGVIGEHTVILSLLNGVTSEALLEQRFGADNVVYCVAQGMDATKQGYELRYSHIGQLRMGIPCSASGKQPALDALAAFLTEAEIPFVVEEDILHRLWSKLMLNVGVNQVCMVYEGTYGTVQRAGEARSEMIAAMREVMLVAGREGITLTDDDLNGYVALIDTLSPDGMPSMRQDGLAKRPSEVEFFSGTIRKLGVKHGIATPVNDRLYAKVLEMEAAY